MDAANQKISLKMKHELELLQLELLQFKEQKDSDQTLKRLLVQKKEIEIAIKKYFYDQHQKLYGGSN